MRGTEGTGVLEARVDATGGPVSNDASLMAPDEGGLKLCTQRERRHSQQGHASFQTISSNARTGNIPSLPVPVIAVVAHR